ncbi:GDNF family receptor alpha-2 [Platysternon megacephalum]|uniref:GDNF family receptor alpha-2 n=1 Tax=Platysternon megacephalum TaxID=55544 RepID=A0A4D9EE40_9SAUR|nr:GDNF family receptor alpha-2 [Platysternon megacephalum]
MNTKRLKNQISAAVKMKLIKVGTSEETLITACTMRSINLDGKYTMGIQCHHGKYSCLGPTAAAGSNSCFQKDLMGKVIPVLCPFCANVAGMKGPSKKQTALPLSPVQGISTAATPLVSGCTGEEPAEGRKRHGWGGPTSQLFSSCCESCIKPSLNPRIPEPQAT